MLNEFLSALAENNRELAKDKLSLSYHRRNNFFVQLLLNQYFENIDSIKAGQALASIGDIASLEQEISGDRFTLDLFNYLRSVPPRSLAQIKTARAKYILAQQHYDSVQTTEAKDEAVRLLTESASEFTRQGDDYQSFLAQYFKALLLAYSDKEAEIKESVAICNRLKSETQDRTYLALLLRIKYLELNLQNYNSAKPQLDLFEIESLTKRVNDQNSLYTIAIWKLQDTPNFKGISYAINLVGTKELENKDRQNVFGILSNELLKSSKAAKFAALESELEGAWIADSTNIRLVSAQRWRRIGEKYSSLGDYLKAQECLEKALWDNERTISPSQLMAIDYLALAELSSRKKNFVAAVQYFDKVFENAQRNFKRQEELFFRINLVKALISSGDKVRATQVLSELKKYINLFQFSGNEATVLRERLKRVLVEYYLKLENDPSKALAAYAESKLDLLSPGRFDELPVGRIQELQSTIKPNSKKIIYLVGESESSVWVISSENYEYHRINIGKVELGEKVKKFLSLLSAESSIENQSKALRLSQELYEVLIHPLDPILSGGSKLSFYSDESLNLLPYSYLQNPQTGKFLFEDHEVQVIKIIDGENENRPTRKQSIIGKDIFVGISNPTFDKFKYPVLKSLDSADLEIDKISALFPRQGIIKGKDASLSRVVSGFKDAQVLHLSTHSVLDEDKPWQSKLLLSKVENGGEDFLTADSIRGMKLSHIKFVCLSSCKLCRSSWERR